MKRWSRIDASTDALQIIYESDQSNDVYALDERKLATILLRDDVRNKKIVLISVAGAYRKGKSFLLNFLLRYLQRKTNDTWIGGDSEILTGFPWRGGTELDTIGILLWKEPFFVKLANGEEIVVLLMDTQGSFDIKSTVKDNATIFAFATMVSSILLYNLDENIQEDDLEHLQYFMEYGRLASETSSTKPFQSLLFLVRDWSYPYEYEYGFQGGSRVLEKTLQTSDSQSPALRQLRQDIRSCFSDLKCFLMPDPGKSPRLNPDFEGQLADIDPEFKTSLKTLIPSLLSPENLVVKEIDGKPLTGAALMQYFKSYVAIFRSKDLPQPESAFMLTVQANNLVAVDESEAAYTAEMEKTCGGDMPYMDPQALEETHAKSRVDALAVFRKKTKMGGEKYSASYIEKLESKIEDEHQRYVKSNNAKNLYHFFKTPGTLAILFIVQLLMQKLCDMVFLGSVARLMQYVMLFNIIIIVLWIFARTTGQLRNLVRQIDSMINVLWDMILGPVVNLCGAYGFNKLTGGLAATSKAKSHDNEKQI